MAGAALMPGALFLTFAMIAYGLGAVDLIELGALWVLHFLIGWVYVAISPLFLPAHDKQGKRGNPFAGGPALKNRPGKDGDPTHD
jgi:hypothetical protein